MLKLIVKRIFFSVFLCILFSNTINSTEDDACIETSACLCKLNDNKYIDLSKLNTSDDPLIATHLHISLTYFLFPCKDVNFDAKKYNLNVSETLDNDCAKGTTLCVYNAADRSLTNLGHVNSGKFMNDFPKTWKYTNANKVTSILLECSPQLDSAILNYKSNDANNHYLQLVSPYACILKGHPGLSIGSTLLILVGTIFGVYLVGGALILHCLRGARGAEMVPNLDFWSSIPGLVKDGTIFLLGGCNPMVISSADTYDRI